MNNLELFIFVTFITCVTPGSGVLYTLHNAFNYGIKNAALSPTGNALGVAFMSAIAVGGLGAIIQTNPVLFKGIQIVGAFLLFYFGWKSFHAATINLSNSAIAIKKQKEEKHIKILFSAAFLQLTNPMLIVFLISLFPQFIDPQMDYYKQVWPLVLMFVVICWLVHITYSYTAAYASTKFMGPKFSFWLNKISGALFFFLGGSVLWKVAAF